MVNSTPASRSPSTNPRARRTRSKSPLQEKRSKSQIRTPLQEKSSSENNVSRQAKEKRPELGAVTTTPFPTKPEHILLPSTVRRQRSFQNVENQFPGFFARSQLDHSRQANLNLASAPEVGLRRPPVLQLKKSVTTLRDMYEAHERSSRPSTATTSPALRPMSSSSRLRSCSSSEGLSGRYTWGSMHKISSDDLALLPSLNEMTVRKMGSESSFASRMARAPPLTSSPNYRILGLSSPKMPVFRDEPVFSSDSLEPSSSTGAAQTSSSSPNFVRLGRSSSLGETESIQQPSSPNFVKLGTSSPVQRQDSSPTPSTASNGSLKRKRGDEEERPYRMARGLAFDSSPPYMAVGASSSEQSIQSPDSVPFNSSPPEPTNLPSRQPGTPAFRIPARGSSESFASSHASLQAALSSSPMPPIQYPVVRAPAAAAQTLSVPKRNTRSMQLENQPFSSRLSPVPSEWEEARSSARSINDSVVEVADSALIESDIGNESQIHIITDDHSQEESDELSALPYPPYRSPPLVPMRTNSLYGTLTNSSASNSQSRLNSLRHSVDSRLNSMRSYTHSRQNSLISNSIRPNSSGSTAPNLMVPTWARRYYSGFYRDSFQYLYNPSQQGSATQLPVMVHSLRTQRSQSLIELTHEPSHSTAKRSRYSLQSIGRSLRDSISERVPSLIRPRLLARDSHMTIGVGPLVSNPTYPEPAMLVVEPDPDPTTPTIRRISKGKGRELPPADPRAHWADSAQNNGMFIDNGLQHIPRHSAEIQDAGRQSVESASIYYSASAASGGMPSAFRFLPSPHLHRDHRLNTGSSTSRGYGHPFNHKPKYHPARAADNQPDGYGRPGWYSLDLHSTQVFLFILGFVCPISWFLGSILPLPNRPTTYTDLEKMEWESATLNGTRPVSEWEEIDVVARLRMERHLKGMEEVRWQNARWWRRMNRFMSVVGIVVVVVAVVLAVIATRGGL